MHTLDRYITGISMRSIAVVVFALLALISLFALFEEMDESQTGYGLVEAATYVLATTPRRLDEILVYGVFLGFLIALGRLAEANELTICRVAGLSPLRLMGSLAPTMIFWLAFSLVLSESVAPNAERVAEVGKLKAQFGEEALDTRGGLWLRTGPLFMRVRAIGDDGAIYGVVQHRLDENGALAETVNAASGRYDTEAKLWRLENGTRVRFPAAPDDSPSGGALVEPFEQHNWNNDITPELLASQAYLEPNKMSMAALSRQIEFARNQHLGVSEYELAFWSRALKPLTFFGLTLFALAVVLGPLRQVGMGMRLTVGIFAGLGFKYLQDLFSPAALVFNIPALLATLLPIAMYWLAAWYLVRRNA